MIGRYTLLSPVLPIKLGHHRLVGEPLPSLLIPERAGCLKLQTVYLINVYHVTYVSRLAQELLVRDQITRH